MNQELANGEVPGTLYGVSENGWITQQLFKEWFHRHFLAFIPSNRPVVLLMDAIRRIITQKSFEWLLHVKLYFAHYHPIQLT